MRPDLPPLAGCPDADVHPFGLGRDDAGTIYVGATYSAESGGAPGAAIYRLNADDTMTPVYTSNLGRAAFPWQRWQTPADVANAPAALPQPLLADIDFAGPNLVIGVRDRYADQIPAAGRNPTQPPRARGHCDVLRACPAGTGTWSDAACAGPGGSSFYVGDVAGSGSAPGTPEAGLGGLVQVPGFDLIVTAYDPTSKTSSGAAFLANRDAGGVQRFSNATGRQVGTYNLYTGWEPDRFNKANGLGDLEALCGAAPVQIGNRVWRDRDADGVQDAGEPGIDGVTVELVDAQGVVVATAVTSGGGQYLFPITPAATYTVRIPTAQPALAGLVPSPANAPLGNDCVDSDGIVAGGTDQTAVGAHGAGENDHCFDFGFVDTAAGGATYSLGNLIWLDANDNGRVDGGEQGIAGLTVTLLRDGVSSRPR